MKSTTKNATKSVRDIHYYRQRFKNRVHSKLVSWVSDEASRLKLTKKDIAERLGKDPGQISRLLNQPSNLTLDTISDMLLAFDSEAEPFEITLFQDKAVPNYMHPLIAKVLKVSPKADPTTSSARSNSNSFELPVIGSGILPVSVSVKVAANAS
jgi:transcriptional regulator with XRE-family HTH domain